MTPLRRASAGSVPPDGLRGRQQGRAFLPRGTIQSNQEATLGAVHRTAGTCQGVSSGTGGEMGAGLWAWRNDSTEWVGAAPFPLRRPDCNTWRDPSGASAAWARVCVTVLSRGGTSSSPDAGDTLSTEE